MALTAAQRMARLRARQRVAGLTSLSLVVPTDDVMTFVRFAEKRRTQHHRGKNRSPATAMLSRRIDRLRATQISPADILAFRELLEVSAVTLAVRRMNAQAARRLRAEIASESALPVHAGSAELQRLHSLVGELSGDEALQLLLRIALQLTDDRSAFAASSGASREQIVARVKRLHAGIVEALIDRNEALAIRRMRRYLSGLREWLE